MTPSFPTSSIADNLAEVNRRIAVAAARAGREFASIRLVAVSKAKPASAVWEAFAAGQLLFGENRVQEAVEKIEMTGPGPEWHLIGHLQRNKARLVPGRFALVHSVDSVRLAETLERHCAEAGVRLDVLLQLNLQQEASKGGAGDESELRRLAETVQAAPNLTPRGLMTIPEAGMNEAETRRLYARIRELHAAVKSEFALEAAFDELSFGMSHDFEWAIEEGATLVRVGTAIFGARP